MHISCRGALLWATDTKGHVLFRWPTDEGEGGRGNCAMRLTVLLLPCYFHYLNSDTINEVKNCTIMIFMKCYRILELKLTI